MADFTTWAALKTAILNDLSNGSVLTKSYMIEGRQRTFQDLDQVRRFLELCDTYIMSGSSTTRIAYTEFGGPA